MKSPLSAFIVPALALMSVVAVSRGASAQAPHGSQSLWTATTPKTDAALKDPLVRRGKTVFDGHCRTCHGAGSAPAGRAFFPGTYALEMRYKGKLPAALEERTDLTADRVESVVRHGGGGFMPPLRPTELDDNDLKALAAYLSRRTAAH